MRRSWMFAILLVATVGGAHGQNGGGPAAPRSAQENELTAVANQVVRSAASEVRRYLPDATIPRVNLRVVPIDDLVLSGRQDDDIWRYEVSAGALQTLSAADLVALTAERLLTLLLHGNHANAAVEMKIPFVDLSAPAHTAARQELAAKKLDAAGQESFLDALRGDKATVALLGVERMRSALQNIRHVATAGGVVAEPTVIGDPEPSLRLRLAEIAVPPDARR